MAAGRTVDSSLRVLEENGQTAFLIIVTDGVPTPTHSGTPDRVSTPASHSRVLELQELLMQKDGWLALMVDGLTHTRDCNFTTIRPCTSTASRSVTHRRLRGAWTCRNRATPC